MAEQTYLDKLIEETIRPVLGALDLLVQEMEDTMNIPDAPWKILNKPYDQLTEQEMAALFDIYHTDGETEPCPMCKWATKAELTRLHQDQKRGF